jgi:hypothetical protein
MTKIPAKASNVFPYPLKKVTSTPTKKMAMAVTILPMLKQIPLNVPRILTENNCGM